MVDKVQQVTWEPSSHTAVDVHRPPLPCDIANTPLTIIQELRPETLPPTTQTTTTSIQQTLPGSHSITPVQSWHPPLIEVLSPTTNIQAYLKVSDHELESERDSLTPNPIPGSSTPTRDTSTSTTSAPTSSKIAPYDGVPSTSKLDNKSYPKRERKQMQR